MTSVHLRIVSHSFYRSCIQNHFKLSRINTLQCSRRLLSNINAPENNNNTKSRLNFKTIAAVAVVPVAYMVYDYFRKKEELLNYKEPDVVTMDHPPNVPIDYKIVNPDDKTNLDLILFQCQTCPFCCKMIAFLNSKGFSYSVVSVDEPFERRMKWSHQKQVPCLLARTKDGKYIELTNSSVIISILTAILNNPEKNIEELAKLYPKITYIKANGIKKHGIVNKYDLKYEGKLPKGVTLDSIQ